MLLNKDLRRVKRSGMSFRGNLLRLCTFFLIVLLAGCGGRAEKTVTPGISANAPELTAAISVNTPGSTPEISNTPGSTPEISNTPESTPEISNTPESTPDISSTPGLTPEISVTLPELNALTVTADPGKRDWDYVAIGDSIPSRFINQYANMLVQDLGVRITFHNYTKAGALSSMLLARLRSNAEMRQDLRDAEVITFEIPWFVVRNAWMTYQGKPPGASCGGADNQDCLREAFNEYKSDTDAIIAEIVSLRSPSDALIRTMDTYQLKARELKQSGIFDIVNPYWRDANMHLIETATKYHIPVARVYDAFMGESGTDDPMDKGLVVSDGIHTTWEGGLLIAKLFRELGYAYAPRAP